MMIAIFITVVSAVALAVDFYIWRRVLNRYNPGKAWKYGYLAYALLVDTMVVSALLFYRGASEAESGTMLRAVMWVFAIFFLNAAPKALYAIVSLGDYVVGFFTGRRSRVFGGAGLVMALLLAGVIINGMSYGRTRLRVEHVDLTFDKLPASFDGLRVVQFSDLHTGTLVDREGFTERLVDAVNGLRPDVILQTGDIVNINERELDERMMEILGRMESTYGVYAVLGNHDMGYYAIDTLRLPPAENVRRLVAKQEAMGWRMLLDRTVYIDNGEDSIAVTGLDYPRALRHNRHTDAAIERRVSDAYAGVPEGVFDITLTHIPQLWNNILGQSGADLTVAGHVHAMQIKARAGGWKWSPSAMMYTRWSGLYEEDGRYLYINDGLGYVMFPMRIGTRPEITLFTLRSGNKNTCPQ